MAKRKTKSSDETTPAPAALSVRERAERVLASQGRAIGLCRDALEVELAQYCSPAGEILPGVVEGVREIFAAYYAEQKAVVDELTTSQEE